ncbi:MAG: T9SS type A sorting domain-containing protein, partial [Candidatus Cloacimonetes bacterium]|nr:T9SS type A sorting domain-containing protein [Candidatus Cloacimonadota bacterium]
SNLTYYSVFFTGNSKPILKSKCLAIESFINGGMQVGDTTGLTCLPYFYEPTVELPSNFHMAWQSYTDPDHFEVLYKVFEAPASQWVSVTKPGSSRSHNLNVLDPDTWYEMKIASIYNPGPNEIYLESETKLVNFNVSVDNDDPISISASSLVNYPNPFNPSTVIEFELKQPGDTRLVLYNLKGQQIKVLEDNALPAGVQKRLWDGKDKNGAACASGIYYLRLTTGITTQTRKILLMK